MDGEAQVGDNGAEFIHGLADDVHDAPERGPAHRHRDRAAQVLGLHAPHHTVGRLHGDTFDAPLAQVLFDLCDDPDGLWPAEAFRGDADGVEDGRQVPAFERSHDHRSGNFHDFPGFGFCHGYPFFVARASRPPKANPPFAIYAGETPALPSDPRAAAYDLDNLFGDRRLADAVHGQCQMVNHL